MFKIANYFVDEAGLYFVRVVINENQTVFFTFDQYPTQEEVDAKAQQYLDSLNGSPGQNIPINA